MKIPLIINHRPYYTYKSSGSNLILNIPPLHYPNLNGCFARNLEFFRMFVANINEKHIFIYEKE